MTTNSDPPLRTAHKTAGEAARFRDYADAEADWFWELDPNFRFTIVSRRHEGRSAVREYDLLGKTPWEFADADPANDPEWAAFVASLERRAPFRNFRICLTEAAETPVYWRLSGKPVVDDDGVFFGYRGIATDETVTALKHSKLERLADDYQALLEGVADGIAYFDARARLIFANAAFREILAFSKDDIEAGTSYAAVVGGIAKRLAQGQTRPSEAPTRRRFDWRLADGRRVLGEIKSVPSGGHVLMLLGDKPRIDDGGSKDIEPHFTELMESSPQGFFIHVDGRIVFANPAAAEIFGCTRGMLSETSVWDFILPSEVPRLRRFANARLGGEYVPERYQVMGRRFDGTPAHLEFLVRIGSWEGKHAFEIFVQDRTAERRAERALAGSERKFRNLVEGSIQGLLVHRDWRIIYANAAAARMFGYASGEIVDIDIRTLIAPEELDLIAEIRRRRIAGEVDVPERYEIEGKRKDGSPVWVEFFSRLVEWDGGDAIQVTTMDITRRKEVETSLVNAKDVAEHADRAKTEFLGNMSHELRTPLNAIIGFSQLIRDKVMGDLSQNYVDYGGSIYLSGMYLLELVNDLLDVASIESGSVALHDEDVDACDIARSCERMLRGRAQKAGLLISVDAPSEAVHLRADRRRMKQIFINLLGNAIKFTEQGGQVVMRVARDDDGRVRISVADTGIGIAEEHLETVFDAFFRVDTVFVSQREGTGLGLPLVRALADLHGAEIETESKLGVGTTITLTFPGTRSRPATPDSEQ